MNELEKANYSYYQADNTVQIKKYLGENPTLLMTTIIRALRGEKSLVLAPTGSGKTKEMITLLKDHDIKAIFIVPNAFNVEQIKQEYDISGASGDTPVMQEIQKGNLIALTWDKFGQLDESILKDYIVVLDEVHQTYIDMFRINKINKLYENLRSCKGEIHITATPNKLNFEQYNYILEYKQENKTNYNVFLYDKIDDEKIIDIVSRSKKFALFKNDKKYLDFIKDSILNKSIDVVTSDLRGFSKAYNEIVEKGTINKIEGLCNTSVLVAGVNIKEPNITDIIIIGEKDIATIKQYIARFRDLKTVNVHIFNNYKDDSKIYEVEWLIQQLINEISGQIEKFNLVKPEDNFILETLNIKPIGLEKSNFYYLNENTNRYEINEIGIRNHAYTNYYNKAAINNFKVLLEEYFNNIEIINLDDPNNNARKKYNEIVKIEKEQILEELEPHKNELVGAVQILTGNINNEIEKYLDEIKTTPEAQREILKDYKNYIENNNIAKILKIYTKYVINNEFPYEIAWSIATKGNRARGKIFAQINNITYRKVEKKYKKYIDDTNIENRLYRQIVKYFKPNISYTTEHLEMFIEAFKNIAPIKMTTKELSEKLNIIFKIDVKRTRDVSSVDNIFLYKIVPTQDTQKFIKIFTIVDFTTIDDLKEQNNWSEIDTKILKNLINKRVREVDKKVKKIEYGLEVFEA